MLPAHNCGLFLTHNEHLNYHETAEQYLSDAASRSASANWKDDESKQRAIQANEIWELQWYPRTPVASYCVAAPTLQEVLSLAIEVNG